MAYIKPPIITKHHQRSLLGGAMSDVLVQHIHEVVVVAAAADRQDIDFGGGGCSCGSAVGRTSTSVFSVRCSVHRRVRVRLSIFA
jgi:hypothetical protein